MKASMAVKSSAGRDEDGEEIKFASGLCAVLLKRESRFSKKLNAAADPG